MAAVQFVVVVSQVNDGAGNAVAGPVQGLTSTYLSALETRVAQYWSDVSGGRVQVTWSTPVELTLSQTLGDWSNLTTRDKLAAARSQANVPDGTHLAMIANDAVAPSASTPSGGDCYVHAEWLAPATVAHEMGHFFEWAGSRRGGHADVARTFFRDEYADPTCLMGGEGTKYSFADGLIPALPTRPGSTWSGPLMNPALVDQCGWLDLGSPLVVTLDRTALGSARLQPWTGAPPEVGPGGGSARVVVVEGVGPEESRLYVCVRRASGWDRGFPGLGLIPPLHPLVPVYWVCAYLETRSADSLLLAAQVATRDSWISLQLVPIGIRIGQIGPEGVDLEFFPDAWRGTAPIEGVEARPRAQVAVAAWGRTADIYVIDRAGQVCYNHFNGDGWEHKPWPVIAGVTCDPAGGIAAVARREGLVDVFVVDTDDVVRRRQRHHRNWSPDWAEVSGGGLDRTSSLAAARLDEQTLLLCGVRPGDQQVSRTLIDADGMAANWESAPNFRMRRVAATSADDDGGRIYATAVGNPDRTIWDTPDAAFPDPTTWQPVGELSFDAARPITASRVVDDRDFVVAGTDPLTVLFWKGLWQQVTLPAIARDAEGGLAGYSMHPESFQVAYVDTVGGVNQLAWSPRHDFPPANNQYQTESTVVFQVSTGHFIQANGGGGAGMSADSGNLGAWEKLRMLEAGSYTINAGATRRVVVFQTHDGHYVSASGGGGSHLFATATKVGPWERFYLHELGNSRVTVGCINEIHFWTANGGGGAALGADKANELEWETFTMVVVSP